MAWSYLTRQWEMWWWRDWVEVRSEQRGWWGSFSSGSGWPRQHFCWKVEHCRLIHKVKLSRFDMNTKAREGPGWRLAFHTAYLSVQQRYPDRSTPRRSNGGEESWTVLRAEHFRNVWQFNLFGMILFIIIIIITKYLNHYFVNIIGSTQ